MACIEHISMIFLYMENSFCANLIERNGSDSETMPREAEGSDLPFLVFYTELYCEGST